MSDNDVRAASRSRDVRLLLVLGCLVALGPLTTDMYLPALPAITTQLSSSASAVQLTLTGTLAGLGLGQLLIGPLSDVVGRRKPLLIGVAVHVLASVLCAVATDLSALGLFRVLQGLGAATSSVISMAIVRDRYTDSSAARVLSRLMIVLGVAPVLSPTVGGLILAGTSWRGIFVVLAVVGALVAVAAAGFLPETLPPERRRSASLRAVGEEYGRLLRDRRYVGLILVAGLAMTVIFAYIAGSPFAFQDHFGLSEQQFGFLFGGGALFLIGASQWNVRLLRHGTPARILVMALLAALVVSLVLLGFAASGTGGLLGVLIPLWALMFVTGLIMPNAPALALSRHGEAAGTAAALLGAVQFGIGAVAAPLVGTLGTGPAAMAVVMAVGLAAAVIVLVGLVRPWSAETSNTPEPSSARVR